MKGANKKTLASVRDAGRPKLKLESNRHSDYWSAYAGCSMSSCVRRSLLFKIIEKGLLVVSFECAEGQFSGFLWDYIPYFHGH